MKCRERQPQEIGGDLRKTSPVGLAGRLGSEHKRHATVRLEADLRPFARRAARCLQKTRNAKPAQPAALRRSPSPRSKAVGQDPLRHLVEIGAEAAAIDRDPETAAIWEKADQVTPAQR